MAQRFSQNGWPAYPDTSNYVRGSSHGFAFWAANEDVEIIFDEIISFFDTEIEEITQKILDDWSYANRLVRGSATVVSNHGSATAIDLNATQHPRGVHNTFTASEMTKLRNLKARLSDNAGVSVIRLGLDYKTTVDDMHFEINANRARVKEAADKIRRAREIARLEKENVLNADDKKWIGGAVIAAVESVFEKSAIIPNKPVEKGEAAGANWTPVGVLAAGDQKTDLQGRMITALQTEVAELKAGQAEILRLVGRLSPADPA